MHCFVLRCTEAFIGMLTMGANLTVENLRVILDSIERPATAELMTHPGYPLEDPLDWTTQGCSPMIGPDGFSQSADRLHEKNLLQGTEFRELLHEKKINLKRFSDF